MSEQRLSNALSGKSNIEGLNRKLRQRWAIGCVYSLLAIFFLIGIFHPASNNDLTDSRVLRIDQLHIDKGNSLQRVQLPDRWLRSDISGVHKQYQLTFNRADIDAEDVSLYLPSVSKNFRITVNNSTIPVYGEIGSSPSWSYNRPHILSIPSGLLLPANNQLLLDIYAHSVHDGVLGVFYLGDSDVLLVEWQREWFLSIGVTYVMVFVAVIFMVVLGFVSGGNGIHYKLMAVGCVCALVASRRWLVVDPGLDPAQHLALSELMISSFNMVAMVVLYRVNNAHWVNNKLQTLSFLAILFLELSLFVFAKNIDTVYEVTRWSKLLSNISTVTALCLSLLFYVPKLNLLRVMIIFSLVVALAGGVHDTLIRFALFEADMSYRYQWSMLFLWVSSFIYIFLDASRKSEELDAFKLDFEDQVRNHSTVLKMTREKLVETQRWSELGVSTMTLWRKFKMPLQEIFESSSAIRTLAIGREQESTLTALSYRSMYSAQRCLRTIDEIELLATAPVVEMIELDMDRWTPELLLQLRKRIRVQLSTDRLDECRAYGDPYLLRDCIERLVDNADRACERTGGHCVVDVSVRLEEGFVILSVADNGPGIAANLAARLEEPFDLGDPTGLGVGLCIVKHYSELMNIEVRSAAVPKGTCIELVFPQLI